MSTRPLPSRGAVRWRAPALVAALALLVSLFTFVLPTGASAQPSVGVPEGTKLTPSGSVKVKTDGAVVDALDVTGAIVIDANNVTVKRTRVTYGGYHAIRIMPGRAGAVIEDVDIVCTFADGKGIIAGGYTARRVDVTGCKKPFVHSEDDPAVIEGSYWNGNPVGDPAAPAPTPAPTQPPTTPAPTQPPTTPPPTPAPAPATGTIQWSAKPDRSGAKALDGATVSGTIHVTLTTEAQGVERVVWSVEGKVHRDDDLFAPYDLVPAGNGQSGAFDTKTLSNGSHKVSAVVHGIGGSTTTVSATFTVANQGSTPSPTTPPPTNPTPSPTPSEPAPGPLPGGMPSRKAIIDGAGLSNPSALRPSGSVVVSQAGATIKDLDISGGIVVKADNVTIRNVRVTGSSSTALIRIDNGVKGTTIEDCVVNVTSGGANGGIGYLGTGTTVRRCEITGYADGIKAESGGLYEYNYIHMWKPAGSAKHLDGIQGSGDSDYTIRRNVIDQPIASGGNSAIFVQAWYGSGNAHVRNVTVEQNYVRGGNFVVYLEGGKDKDGSDPKSWVHGYRLVDNVFSDSGYRYGLVRVANCAQTTVKGNRLEDGRPVNVC